MRLEHCVYTLQDPGENPEKGRSGKAHIQGATESLFTCAQCITDEVQWIIPLKEETLQYDDY